MRSVMIDKVVQEATGPPHPHAPPLAIPRPLVILGTRGQCQVVPTPSRRVANTIAMTRGGGRGWGGGGRHVVARGEGQGDWRSGGLLWGGRGRGWSGWEGEGGDYEQSARHRQPVSEVYGVRYADLRRRFRIKIITCTGNYFWFST